MYEKPHRRCNPLTGEWVLVSPHRTQRPWQGKIEPNETPELKRYDPECYLCPGNHRAGGFKNPDYSDTFVFINDFAALLPDTGDETFEKSGLLNARAERGICKVICFSPRHDLTVPLMTSEELCKVIRVWQKEYNETGKNDHINYVQIFENRGAMMGCSNPHPHCQIWSNETVPDIPNREGKRQLEYLHAHGKCLLCEYIFLESKANERVVYENDFFCTVVPFWAVWPYETIVLPKLHHRSLLELSAAEVEALADCMKMICILYDNLFKTQFPYSMGIHAMPTDGSDHAEWHFHLHYYPPLLRSATVRKFMVGYELLANPQRDITPETAAAVLRGQPRTHYLSGTER